MSGLSFFEPVKHYLKFPKIWIDNTVFRLHCKLSVFIILLCCMLSTVTQFFGKPIECLRTNIEDGPVTKDILNTYCWITSTFTLPRKYYLTKEADVAHPGVGPYSIIEEGETVNHKYYQWVCFTLAFQAFLFLVPYELWKHWEGGRVSKMIHPSLIYQLSDKKLPSFAMPSGLIVKEKRAEAINHMSSYFVTKGGEKVAFHSHYILKLAVCEVLNMINVVFQMILMNVFLGHTFSNYGYEVITMSQRDPEERMDPLNEVFPKVAKCTFHKYGPSGTIQNWDGLCVLPLNIINEKIYVLLWFYFYTLAILSGIQLIWRALTLYSPLVRRWFLWKKTGDVSEGYVNLICEEFSEERWFLLIQISSNICTMLFDDLLKDIATKLKDRRDANGQGHQADMGQKITTAV